LHSFFNSHSLKLTKMHGHALVVTLAAALAIACCAQAVEAGVLSCNRHVPSTYATVAAAVLAAVNGDVICVAAGVYPDAYFDLATKGLTLQGAQAGVDARTRGSRTWVPPPVGSPPSYPSDETVFTHNGGVFFSIKGGEGATVDGIFVRIMHAGLALWSHAVEISNHHWGVAPGIVYCSALLTTTTTQKSPTPTTTPTTTTTTNKIGTQYGLALARRRWR
jgi:hypothetical protein